MYIRTFPHDKASYEVQGDVPTAFRGGDELLACGGFYHRTPKGISGAVFSRAKRLPSGWPQLCRYAVARWNSEHEIFVIG